jgi:hypothetical protein
MIVLSSPDIHALPVILTERLSTSTLPAPLDNRQHSGKGAEALLWCSAV